MKDIIIRSGEVLAHVNAFGAELKGLSMNGFEYLYDGDPRYYGRTSPTLFPIIGRFLSDTYFDGDQWYQMPLNGIAQNRNFAVAAQGEDFVTFVLTDDEETRSMYPYHFRLEVTYQVRDGQLHVDYCVTNTGETGLLPFGLGCHTAYCWPLTEDEAPEDCFIRFEKKEDIGSFNPFGWKDPIFVRDGFRPLEHDLFRNFTRSIYGLKSEWVEFASRKHSHSVRIHRSEFPYLAIWASPDENAKVICIEPCTSIQAGACLGMFDRSGVQVLQPGEQCRKRFAIEPRQ